MLLVFLLSCDPADMRNFMLHAYDLHMLDGTYAFISIGLVHAALQGNYTWQGNDGRDRDARKAFEGE